MDNRPLIAIIRDGVVTGETFGDDIAVAAANQLIAIAAAAFEQYDVRLDRIEIHYNVEDRAHREGVQVVLGGADAPAISSALTAAVQAVTGQGSPLRRSASGGSLSAAGFPVPRRSASFGGVAVGGGLGVVGAFDVGESDDTDQDAESDNGFPDNPALDAAMDAAWGEMEVDQGGVAMAPEAARAVREAMVADELAGLFNAALAEADGAEIVDDEADGGGGAGGGEEAGIVVGDVGGGAGGGEGAGIVVGDVGGAGGGGEGVGIVGGVDVGGAAGNVLQAWMAMLAGLLGNAGLPVAVGVGHAVDEEFLLLPDGHYIPPVQIAVPAVFDEDGNQLWFFCLVRNMELDKLAPLYENGHYLGVSIWHLQGQIEYMIIKDWTLIRRCAAHAGRIVPILADLVLAGMAPGDPIRWLDQLVVPFVPDNGEFEDPYDIHFL